jgi:hypothetical protein
MKKHETPKLSNSDGMALKLGIITVCYSCQKRIVEVNGLWVHEKTQKYYCSQAYPNYPLYAKPRQEK